jgi:hypothetical protein
VARLIYPYWGKLFKPDFNLARGSKESAGKKNGPVMVLIMLGLRQLRKEWGCGGVVSLPHHTPTLLRSAQLKNMPIRRI